MTSTDGVATRRTGHPPRTSHRDRLRRYLALMHGLLLLGFVVVALVTGLTPSASDAGAHLALAAGLLVLAALTAVGGERPVNLVLAVPLGLLGALPAYAGVGDVSGPLALTAAFLAAVRTLRLVVAVPVVLVLLVAAAAIRTATGGEVGLEVVGSYLLGVANTFVAGAFVGSLERSTEAMDRAERLARRETLRLEIRRGQEDAVRGARRVLHDDVLSALRAIAAAEVPGELQVRLSRQAVEAVDGLLGPGDDAGPGPSDDEPADARAGADAWAASVVADAPIDVDVRLEPASVRWQVDARSRSALHRAASEAVRNAARHASVEQVTLTVRTDLDGAVVEIADRGPGLGDHHTEGVGIRESIRGALADVGGTAVVDSGPGGTTVRLRPAPTTAAPGRTDLAATYDLTMRSGAERQIVPATMVPLTVVWVGIGATFIARDAGADSALRTTLGVLLLVACTVLVGAVTLRLQHRPPGRAWLVGTLGAMLGLQALGLAFMAPGSLVDLRSWSVGYLATPLIVLCFLLPVRWGLLVVASHVVLLLTAAGLRPELLGGVAPVAPVNAVTTSALLTVVLGVGLRRNSARIRAEQARSLAATAELSRQRSVGLVSSLHLDHTRTSVVPWLRAVAQGGVDPLTPQARRRARVLALEARDDLHAPGFHTPELRAATSRFRAAGGVVDIRPGFSAGAHDRLTGVVLRSVLRHVPPPARLTLSPPTPSRERARLVIVPPPPPGGLGLLEVDDRLSILRDGVTTTVEFEETAR